MSNYWISLYAPNGQWGCLTIHIRRIILTIGFVPHMWGADLMVGDRFWSFPRDQKI